MRGAPSKPRPFRTTTMRKPLHSISLLAPLAALVAGCVIETRDRPGSGGGDGPGDDYAAISARWSLRNMRDGASTGCPRGFDTIELVSQEIDDAGAAIGAPAVDLFDCDVGSGRSSALFPGVYQAWIEVRSPDLDALYAQSLSQILDVRRANQVLTTDVLNDGGYFQLAWDLVGKTTNRPLSCDDAQRAGTIDLFSVSVADAQRAYDDPFDCADHGGVTRGLLAGTYTVTLEARAGSGAIASPVTLTNKSIAGQNAITDLGLIMIPIDGL